MPNEHKYFGYQPKNSQAVFIGSPQQIIETVRYYKEDRGLELTIPNNRDISKLKRDINIEVAFALAAIEHNISARIAERFVFRINANAFDYVIDQGRRYHELKRGELYKFSAGVPVLGIWFLPEEVMQGIQQHDWLQYRSEIDQWTAKREDLLNEAERKGIIRRRE